MFEVGDKVVYPMHGAGIIESIEEKEILGTKQLYYVMNINNVQVMFPKGNSDNLGIREIVDLNMLEEALSSFRDASSDPLKNPAQRHRNNMNRLKSGELHEAIQVIRDLTHISKKKNLAVGEKALLNNALQILSSEVVLVKGIQQEEANQLLNQVINNEVINN